MTTKFIYDNDTVHAISLNNDYLQDTLKPAVYKMHETMSGYILKKESDLLTTPPKIYGNAQKLANRFINTHSQREQSTGILLTGTKGTGKSLLSSVTANKAITDLSIPTIIIDETINTNTVKFIDTLGDCCIIIDECAKLMNNFKPVPSSIIDDEDDTQEKNLARAQLPLLTLLDGVQKTKRLVLLTENNANDISELLINRPGRVLYHLNFDKLDEQYIIDYCNDYKIKAKTKKEIINFARSTLTFTHDILQAIVEEHLRYNEPIDELTKILNVSETLNIYKVLEFSSKRTKNYILPEDSYVTISPYDYFFTLQIYVEKGEDPTYGYEEEINVNHTNYKVLHINFNKNDFVSDINGIRTYETRRGDRIKVQEELL